MGAFLSLCVSVSLSVMVMEEETCHEVEEEDCGVCHTIYMENCEMKMLEEMMPTKVQICKNVTRYFHNCSTEMAYTEGEEEQCVEMVKLEKEKHEGKHCSF